MRCSMEFLQCILFVGWISWCDNKIWCVHSVFFSSSRACEDSSVMVENCMQIQCLRRLNQRCKARKLPCTCRPGLLRTQFSSFCKAEVYKFGEWAVTATMPPRHRLSDTDRGRAIAWLQDGVGLREIGRRLGVHHAIIQRLRDRFNATGSTVERRQTGRPRATSIRQDRFLVLSALRQRTATANNLRGQLRATANVVISDQTVWNRLREVNLRARRPAVRPVLTPAHRVARLAWARAHVAWTRQQWARVLFSDESRFTRLFHDGRPRVWRRPGTRFQNANVQERDRYGGGSIMVWGGIGRNYRTPLYRIQGNLTGLGYRDNILQPLVLPAMQALGPGAILQDDNARPHCARVVNSSSKWSAWTGQHVPLTFTQLNMPGMSLAAAFENTIIQKWTWTSSSSFSSKSGTSSPSWLWGGLWTPWDRDVLPAFALMVDTLNIDTDFPVSPLFWVLKMGVTLLKIGNLLQ